MMGWGGNICPPTRRKPLWQGNVRFLVYNRRMRTSFAPGQGLNIQAGMDFYQRYLGGPAREKRDLREQYGFPPDAQAAASGDWELWAAILLGCEKSEQRYGHDLQIAEVKSGKRGGSSFEYQYHRDGGMAKLQAERDVYHIYVTHSDSMQSVEVVVVQGKDLAHVFEAWLPGLQINYDNPAAQRYRKSVAKGTVSRLGKPLLKIDQGKLVWYEERPLEELFRDSEPPGLAPAR